MGFKISQEPSHHLKSFLCSQVELADGDLPVNQRMLRGFSIRQVVGYMGMILLEPPKELTFPVEPCWSQNKEAAWIRLLKIPWSAATSVFELPFFSTPFSGGPQFL